MPLHLNAAVFFSCSWRTGLSPKKNNATQRLKRTTSIMFVFVQVTGDDNIIHLNNSEKDNMRWRKSPTQSHGEVSVSRNPSCCVSVCTQSWSWALNVFSSNLPSYETSSFVFVPTRHLTSSFPDTRLLVLWSVTSLCMTVTCQIRDKSFPPTELTLIDLWGLIEAGVYRINAASFLSVGSHSVLNVQPKGIMRDHSNITHWIICYAVQSSPQAV